MSSRPLFLGLLAITCWGTLAAAAGGALRHFSASQLLFYSFATSTLVLAAGRGELKGRIDGEGEEC